MNKILKGLLVAMLAVSAQANAATTAPATTAPTTGNYTSKTFMTPRSHGVNLAIENVGFAELVNRKAEEKFGGNFQIAGYWQQSKDTTTATASSSSTSSLNNAASYFLTDPNSNQTVIVGALASTPYNNGAYPAAGAVAAVVAQAGILTNETTQIQANYIIKAGSTLGTNSALIMNPLQKSWGVTFDYNQDLSKVFHGLYMYATLPVAGVQNNLNLNAGAGNTSVVGYFKGALGNAAAAPVAVAASGTAPAIAAFGIAQQELKYAQINGQQTQTGVADLDLGLGYKFLDRENYSAKLALAVTVPTGNKAQGIYLFEPMVGNGGHVGLGFDFDGQAQVWGDEEHNLKLNLVGQYRYLFDSNDVRTLSLQGYPEGQYYLAIGGGAVANGAAYLPYVPLANITTLGVNVKAGNQFEGILGLAYNNGGFSVDLGYNLYYRDGETLSLKNAFAADSQYVIANPAFNTGVPAVVSAPAVVTDTGIPATFTASMINLAVIADTSVGSFTGANAIVSAANLDMTSAATPSQFTNKVYAGLSYSFKEWDNPFMVGVFGGYEFVSRNSALEQWNVGAKAGLGF